MICSGPASGRGPSGSVGSGSSRSSALTCTVVTPPPVGMLTHPASRARTASAAGPHIHRRLIESTFSRSMRIVGRQLERRLAEQLAAVARDREPEAAASARLAPDVELAAVDDRVLLRDRQAEAGAAGRPLPRRVGAPEPVEHPGHLVGGQPHPEVAHRDRDRLGVAVDVDHDRAALPVIDRVAQQVLQDAADAAGVDVGLEVPARRDQPDLGVLLLGERHDGLDGVVDEPHQVRRLDLELHRARVVPAHLEQVGEQHLEAIGLGVQQLGGAFGRRREVVALVVQHLARQPDRGERRAQLVRHVADETLLHARQVGELTDLPLQRVGHPVERARQRGELVVAALGQALLQVPGGQLLAGLGRDPHRADHEPHHQVGDRADQDDQRQPAEHQRLLHEVEAALHVADVVDEEQLVVLGLDVEQRPRDDRRVETPPIRCVDGQRLPRDGVHLAREHRLAKLGGDHALLVPLEVGAVEGGRLPALIGRPEDRDERPGRDRLADRLARILHRRLEILRLAGLAHVVEDALGVHRGGRRLEHDLVLAPLEEVGAHAGGDVRADDRHRDHRQQQRQRDDAHPQRAAPEPEDPVQRRTPVVAPHVWSAS